MSDFLDNDTDDDLDEPTVTLSQADAKAQRALARKGEKFDAAMAERDAAQRELAFLKAGVDPDSALGKLFTRGYDGELTAEAIKTAAAEIPGLVAEATSTESTETLTPEQEAAAQAEAEQTSQRQQLSSGNANAGTPAPRDPRELAAEAVAAARKSGASDEKALAAGLGELVSAAANNDPRVRIHVWDNAEA